MKFQDLINEQEKTELQKKQDWQEILNQYYLKLSNINSWLIFERRNFINLYGVNYCPLPKWFYRNSTLI
jgi:hypothetical protein